MVEEHAVHRAAHRLVAAEREAEVGEASTNVRAGAAAADLARRLDEVDRVATMLVDPGGDGEDIGVEHDVVGVRAVGDEELIRALANRDLALGSIGLADFVERHHHDGRTISTAFTREVQERPLAFLHADRIDDRLARHAFEAGLDHAPFGAVDHHRHAGDVGLGGDALQEDGHRLLAVEQRLVDVDVDDLRAVLDLVARDIDRRVIIAGHDQLLEAGRAGDVAALADIDESRTGAGDTRSSRACRGIVFLSRRRKAAFDGSGRTMTTMHRLEPGEQGAGSRSRDGARRAIAHRPGNCGDVRGSRPAAAADDVDEAAFNPVADLGSGLLRRLVIFAKLVGQPGIGISHHQRIGDRRQRGEMRPQLRRAERAIEPDRHRTGVADDAQKASTVWPEGCGRRGRSGHRDHQRQLAAERLLGFEGCHDRRLGVERVEDRLDQDEFDPAFDQRIDLLPIDGLYLVEVDFAKAGSLTLGDSDNVLLVGPSAPATQRCLPSRVRDRANDLAPSTLIFATSASAP